MTPEGHRPVSIYQPSASLRREGAKLPSQAVQKESFFSEKKDMAEA